MTKEQYKEWAVSTISSIEMTLENSRKFVEQMKQHDKESAAIISQQLKLNEDLRATLTEWLAKNGS